MTTLHNFRNTSVSTLGLDKKPKRDFDIMLEAITMVALKHKVNLKVMNHEQVLAFVERKKSEVDDEYKNIEQNKKLSNKQNNSKNSNKW